VVLQNAWTMCNLSVSQAIQLYSYSRVNEFITVSRTMATDIFNEIFSINRLGISEFSDILLNTADIAMDLDVIFYDWSTANFSKILRFITRIKRKSK